MKHIPQQHSPITNKQNLFQGSDLVTPKKSLKKKRCFECNKRLNFLPITCKCGVVTCIQHKWPDHNCTHDYRAEAQKQLTKENPVVIAEKLNRI